MPSKQQPFRQIYTIYIYWLRTKVNISIKHTCSSLIILAVVENVAHFFFYILATVKCNFHAKEKVGNMWFGRDEKNIGFVDRKRKQGCCNVKI